jgi:hypothetical protein
MFEDKILLCVSEKEMKYLYTLLVEDIEFNTKPPFSSKAENIQEAIDYQIWIELSASIREKIESIL